MKSSIDKIVDCLLTNGFMDEVEKRGLPKTYKAREVQELFAEYTKKCGLKASVSDLRRAWSILRRTRSMGETKAKDNERALTITPALALYLAAYDIHGEEAAMRVYHLLEPVILGSWRSAAILFVPITPQRLHEQAKMLAQLINGDKRLCARLQYYLCMTSDTLPSQHKATCITSLNRACKEARAGAGVHRG